jgi:hypothetical protein
MNEKDSEQYLFILYTIKLLSTSNKFYMFVI